MYHQQPAPAPIVKNVNHGNQNTIVDIDKNNHGHSVNKNIIVDVDRNVKNVDNRNVHSVDRSTNVDKRNVHNVDKSTTFDNRNVKNVDNRTVNNDQRQVKNVDNRQVDNRTIDNRVIDNTVDNRTVNNNTDKRTVNNTDNRVIDSSVDATGGAGGTATGGNSSSSASTGDIENNVILTNGLSNLQVKAEPTYFTFSNGVSTPGTSVYSNVSAMSNSYYGGTDWTASVGVQHTFGGRSKKLALQSVENNNLAQTLATCTALGPNAVIDYEMLPELAPCQYITQKTIVEQTPTHNTKMLKKQLKDSMKNIDEQQNTISALKLRLEQMRHEPTVLEPTW